MNYQNLVSKFRKLAKDFLRMLAINDLRDVILKRELNIKSSVQGIDRCNKRIERAKFKISEIKENDPDKEEKEKDLMKTVQEEELAIKEINEYIEKENEFNNKIREKIEEIVNGTYKVDKEELSRKSRELINEFIKGQAREMDSTEELNNQ